LHRQVIGLILGLLQAPSGDGYRTCAFMYWTGGYVFYRLGLLASFTYLVRGLRGVIWGVRG